MRNRCNICGKFVKTNECEITYINGITINSEYDFIDTQVVCNKCKREYIISKSDVTLDFDIEELDGK